LTKLCAICDTANPEDAKYCQNCGSEHFYHIKKHHRELKHKVVKKHDRELKHKEVVGLQVGGINRVHEINQSWVFVVLV